jgi:phytoene dehydrogenase-like protein
MPDAIIVGAGLAGLAAATRLQEAGKSCLILEASDGVGGRVRTDLVDGFRLDRGFQVYLDAYPRAGQLLDLPSLDLRSFQPGALVFHQGKMHRVMDVFRRPTSLVSSALAPIGSIFDKLRVAGLKLRSGRSAIDDIQHHPDTSTEDHLKAFGFSDAMINVFFRSFYGGIFLERELRTSSRMFEFTFKMFSAGNATIPALGMQEIPQQLASRLSPETLQLNAPVRTVAPGRLTLASGGEIEASHILIATDASAAAKLLPGHLKNEPRWRSVTNLYYASSESPISEPLIALNGTGQGMVNNVCVLTELSKNYAPPGQHLISVSCLGLPDESDLPSLVKKELTSWFGTQTSQWRHLRTDRIPRALPEQQPGTLPLRHDPLPTGIHLCGDHQASASIEGAISSGLDAAESILNAT